MVGQADHLRRLKRDLPANNSRRMLDKSAGASPAVPISPVARRLVAPLGLLAGAAPCAAGDAAADGEEPGVDGGSSGPIALAVS